MKNIILYLSFGLFLIASSEVFAVKVMTFNIWTGKPHKKDSVIAIIKKANPDIVVINEANDADTFYAIADALGYERVLCIHNKYNVGVLSRYKIESHENHMLEVLAKSLVEVKIKIPEWDKPLYLFACHLVALNLTGRNKKRGIEIETILPYIQKRMGDHVIFAGDMNEESHLDRVMPEDCISRLIANIGLTDSYREYLKSPEVSPGFTHNILMIPTKRIDYIYISKQLEVKESETIGKAFYRPWPSDHGAIISDIVMSEKKITSTVVASMESVMPKKKLNQKKLNVVNK